MVVPEALTALPPLPLPDGIKADFVATETGLTHHVLEAGAPGAPLLLLLHGFPELAFSWRRVMPALAAAGYHVVAPDQRGYGRTTGWAPGYDVDLAASSMPNLVRDQVALLRALDRPCHAVIGHDFGSPVAGWAALLRPDVFPRVVCMSSPFSGPPAIAQAEDRTHAALAALPRPRKHYQWYYAERRADTDMTHAPQGLHAFLRAYFHMKSADWQENQPEKLHAWDAETLAHLPVYYVMDRDKSMAETVAPHMPTPAQIAGCAWLPDADLKFYTAEFGRTGLQGGLNWYRCQTSPAFRRDYSVFAGCRIQGPSMFIAGRQDWGWAQVPGALEAMEDQATSDHRGTHLVEGAGHWVQQEQPEAVVDLVLRFLDDTR